MNDPRDPYADRILANTDHFVVFGNRGMGFFVGTAVYPRPNQRPRMGRNCHTYTEMKYLISELIGELGELQRQIDCHPGPGLIDNRALLEQIDTQLESRRGLSLRFAIFRRDGYRCQICGRNAQEHGVTLEVDHRLARAQGGSDDPANLWTLCFDCNRGKSDSGL